MSDRPPSGSPMGGQPTGGQPMGGQPAGGQPTGRQPTGDPLIEQLRRRFPRVAVVHDWLTIPGGSEEVVIDLLEMFPNAELFTSIYDPAPWPATITQRQVHASWLNRVPGAARHYPKLLPMMTAAFRSFDLSRFDLVLSSNHACAKNVRTPPGALHVCYCHTPMRYAWDETLLEGEDIGRVGRLVLPLMLRRLRRQDVRGAASPDVLVANSHHVAERIHRYWGRASEVVSPPVEVDRLLDLPREPGGCYLTFGRVVPYKRVDLAVAACAQLGRPLTVAGDGRALPFVRAVAAGHPAIELVGRVSDAERDRLLSSARALLFPGEEDFGIVPVEAQAAGLPVIAYGVGGATETVIDGRTGVLFGEQIPESLARAIERFEELSLDPVAVRQNAARFSRERFRAEMADVIDRADAARAKSTRATSSAA